LAPFKFLARVLRLDSDRFRDPAKAARKDPAQAAEQARLAEETPLIFVDVDPSQASPETPQKTPYYSAVNSRAGNPDTRRDTGTPKLEGNQDRVLKTMDSVTPSPGPQPMQPSPPSPAPLEVASAEPPAPDPTAAVEPESPPKTEVKPTPEVKPAPVERRESKPELKPDLTLRPEAALAPETKPAVSIGDLETARPGPAASPSTEIPAEPAAPADAPRLRPRRWETVKAQLGLNTQSALAGDKLKQEGGIKRFSIQSSLEVRGTPLGNYDAKFVAAVQRCWFALLEQQRFSLDRMGKVVLDFRLTFDGRIIDLKVKESDVGDIYSTLCELAVSKPAPYEKWPADVRRLVGADSREVRFTFYY
jgi:hypothetical protein